jgi:hypothetical protein
MSSDVPLPTRYRVDHTEITQSNLPRLIASQVINMKERRGVEGKRRRKGS